MQKSNNCDCKNKRGFMGRDVCTALAVSRPLLSLPSLWTHVIGTICDALN